MSSNNDSVAVSVTGGNSSDLPGNSNDAHTLTGEAVLSFHNINYQKTVQHGFPFCKKTRVVERLSNIRYVHEAESTALNKFSKHRMSLLSINSVFKCIYIYMSIYVCKYVCVCIHMCRWMDG